MADCISTENTTEEPRWPRVALLPNPASVTLESRLVEPSRIIHVSNQHTLNFQRSKTEHEGKLDAKSANLQKIHAGSCLQLAAAQAAVAAFMCIYSHVFRLSEAVGFQQLPGKAGGQVGARGCTGRSPCPVPGAPLVLAAPRCACGTQPRAGKLVKI